MCDAYPPSLVDEGVWLYCHHRGNEILCVVSSTQDLDEPVQCATDKHKTTLGEREGEEGGKVGEGGR